MSTAQSGRPMTYNAIKNLSFSLSLLIHLLLLLLFLLMKFTIDYPPKEYVELSFGVSGEIGSSGAIGSQINEVEELAKPEEKDETIDKSMEVKEVELPKAKSTTEENVIKLADKEKKKQLLQRQRLTRTQRITLQPLDRVTKQKVREVSVLILNKADWEQEEFTAI